MKTDYENVGSMTLQMVRLNNLTYDFTFHWCCNETFTEVQYLSIQMIHDTILS